MRLIIDPPQPGAVNMARDEALLGAAGKPGGRLTLRLYRWSSPTVSLGYFQKYADFRALPPPAGELAVVRRTTGGGAILHDAEWTYSLTVPRGHTLLDEPALRLYQRAHDAVIDTLALVGVSAARCGFDDDSAAHRGPFFCFARRHCTDVLIDGAKLAGSAQRRTRDAVLQHGSIMLANRYAQQPSAAVTDHIDLAAEDLVEPLVDAFARRLEVAPERADWTADELAGAASLVDKHQGNDWVRKY